MIEFTKSQTEEIKQWMIEYPENVPFDQWGSTEEFKNKNSETVSRISKETLIKYG